MNLDNKILLVLDLDETLIHSEKQPLYNKHNFKVYSYYVYQRPGLKEFLIEMSKIYSLAVWSAGADIYVDRVVKNIFTDKIPSEFVWARSKCNFAGHPLNKNKNVNDSSLYTKDLSVLKKHGYSMERILIVDDTPRVCIKNLANAIFPKPFYGDRTDDELRILAIYLNQLKDEADVTKIDKDKWKSKIRK